MKRLLSTTIILSLFIPLMIHANEGHIIISEIKTYGQTATDEFVRLYNPTNTAIDISGWKLAKKTSSGAESNLVSSFADGSIISPNSAFLIVHQTGYQSGETPNIFYSGASYSIADNNTIILKDNAGAVIDKVGFGSATDYENEPAINPEKGASIKRQNNIDTDNNKNDFSSTGVLPEETPVSPPPPITEVETSSAEYGDVVVNETVPNPAEGKEWIELLNISQKTINLSGWKISDGSAIIYDLEGALSPGAFLTIEINNRLNNSGDAIYLSDGSEKSIFQMVYGDWQNSKLPAPEKGQSLARNEKGDYQTSLSPTKNSNNNFSYAEPKSENQEASILLDYSKISIIEISPNPDGGDTDNEYIKIFNSGEGLDLGGLYLDDADGGSAPYKIPAGTIINAGSNLFFYRAKTKIALNNNEDEVRILSKNKEEIFSVSYEDANEGEIYKFQNGKWNWNGEKTEKESIKDTSAAKLNSAGGIIIVPPNLFSTQTMYIDGLQLYMYSRDWPDLKIGDKISVFGEPSTYYNEPRLKLKNKNSIKIISSGNEIAPAEITADDIGDDYVGRLVSLEGEVIEKTPQKILIDSAGVEVSIYNKTKIDLADLKIKDVIKISGILSKYKEDFRILPRDKDDFQVLESSKTIDKPIDSYNNLWQYLASTITISALGGGIIYWRKKNGSTKDSGTLG
ncbi:MAG: lamin tail domain-containing protein [Patescibacteria group bacterium]